MRSDAARSQSVAIRAIFAQKAVTVVRAAAPSPLCFLREATVKRIVVNEPGGPEALSLVEGPVPVPGPGEALVAIHTAGVNFIDVYFRSGPLSERQAHRDRQRSRRRRRTRRRRRHSRVAWRSRGLHHGARQLRRLRGRAGREAGAAPRRRRLRYGGGVDAAGHDGTLPDTLDVPARPLAYMPRPRRRGRARRTARADSPRNAARA